MRLIIDRKTHNDTNAQNDSHNKKTHTITQTDFNFYDSEILEKIPEKIILHPVSLD